MKKLLYLILAMMIAACSEDEDNPCIYDATLSMSQVTNVTDTSATLNAAVNVISQNCDDPINTVQGFVISTEIQPTINDVQINVSGTVISATIDDLTPNTTYYVRSFLTNTFGEFYSDEVSFSTEGIIGLLNCDGDPIPTIVYGTQEWTVESACHSTYRDGTVIPQVTDPSEWSNLTTGAWCYYNNDPTKSKLYNWYAVVGIHDTDPSTPNKEFAPEGWHVPTDTEWTTLEEYLIANGYNYDSTTTGNKIAKAMASNTGWINDTITGAVGNNQSINNSSGFNAFPKGIRNLYGGFDFVGEYSGFWSSSVYNGFSWGRHLSDSYSSLRRQYFYEQVGHLVRFVKD